MRTDTPLPRHRDAHGRFVPDDVLRQIREVEAKLKRDTTPRPSGVPLDPDLLTPYGHSHEPPLKRAPDPDERF